ncbi:MAG: hypothetical protein R3A52_31555 [Polyangiales bacterium]
MKAGVIAACAAVVALRADALTLAIAVFPPCGAADAVAPVALPSPVYDPPRPTGVIGANGPTLVVAAAPDARWVHLCQAREDTDGDGVVASGPSHHGSIVGDAMRPYLVVGDGPGERIDDFIDASPDGRFVAFVRRGVLTLLDARASTEHELAPGEAIVDHTNDTELEHLAGGFDHAGRRFVWARKTASGPRVMVRDLTTGTDHEVRPGRGALYRAWIDPAGAWVLSETVPSGDAAELRWSARRLGSHVAPRLCFGPSDTEWWWLHRVDGIETSAASIDDTQMRPVPGFVGVVGRYLLRRDARGALVARSPEGTETEWAPAACEPRVLTIDGSLDRAVVVCDRGGAVTLHGPRTHCALPTRESALGEHPVDLAAARVLPQPPPERPRLSVWALRSVSQRVFRGGRYWAEPVDDEGHLLPRELEPGEVVVAIDAFGRMLTPTTPDPRRRERDFVLGPLEWRLPRFRPTAR